MRTRCLCCDCQFIYVQGDDDCSTLLCSYCFGDMKLKTFGATKWDRLRFRVLTRDGYKCRYCGESPMYNDKIILHVDHVEATSRGGSNDPHNLITSCGQCNFGKYDSKLPKEAKEIVDTYINKMEDK